MEIDNAAAGCGFPDSANDGGAAAVVANPVDPILIMPPLTRSIGEEYRGERKDARRTHLLEFLFSILTRRVICLLPLLLNARDALASDSRRGRQTASAIAHFSAAI